jgi:predicted metal-dependent HD superfamily phosphohydrolase
MGLIDRWTALAGPAAAPLGHDLIDRWSEPHRRYHTPAHLERVLDGVDELAAEADDADAVRFAAWFHDAVYGTGSDTDADAVVSSDGSSAASPAASNEELSARLAEAELPGIGLSPERVAEVARLVRLTAGHQTAPDDRNGAVLCDADLAILGSSPADYTDYTRAIRAEYAAIPDELFRPGRAAILAGLLKLSSLFRTPTARERYEAAARANLAAEIAELTSERGG